MELLHDFLYQLKLLDPVLSEGSQELIDLLQHLAVPGPSSIPTCILLQVYGVPAVDDGQVAPEPQHLQDLLVDVCLHGHLNLLQLLLTHAQLHSQEGPLKAQPRGDEGQTRLRQQPCSIVKYFIFNMVLTRETAPL